MHFTHSNFPKQSKEHLLDLVQYVHDLTSVMPLISWLDEKAWRAAEVLECGQQNT